MTEEQYSEVGNTVYTVAKLQAEVARLRKALEEIRDQLNTAQATILKYWNGDKNAHMARIASAEYDVHKALEIGPHAGRQAMTEGRFTDQKPRVATEADCKAAWDGVKNGKRFRCYLCGYRFQVGDVWRWVAGIKTINFVVCEKCDGEDVRERWLTHIEEAKQRFWWWVEQEDWT